MRIGTAPVGEEEEEGEKGEGEKDVGYYSK